VKRDGRWYMKKRFIAADSVYKELSDKLGVWESERFLKILDAMLTPDEAGICLELFEPATCPELAGDWSS
jgi:hypothetical protein